MYVEAVDSLDKNGKNVATLDKTSVKNMLGENRSHFRFFDDPRCNSWNYLQLNGKKNIKCDSFFHSGGKLFSSKSDLSKLIFLRKFKEIKPPDGKKLLDEMK